jgi:hypothetical protein
MDHRYLRTSRFPRGNGLVRAPHAHAIRPLSLFALLALTSCSFTVTRVHGEGPLNARARWVILPVINYAETAQAGERVEALLDTILRRDGLSTLDRYPPAKDDEAQLMTGDRRRYEESLAWAHSQRFDYAVAGSVEEWRYKSGTDGEPAIGVSLTVVNLSTNRTVWSASGSRVGTSSENASGTALVLLSELLNQMQLQ